MVNPFKHAAATVADAYSSAGTLDYWSPGFAKTMITPFVPVIAAVGFIHALFYKKPARY